MAVSIEARTGSFGEVVGHNFSLGVTGRERWEGLTIRPELGRVNMPTMSRMNLRPGSYTPRGHHVPRNKGQ